jgi:hypothetical protein
MKVEQGRLAGSGPLSASLATYGVLGCWRGPLRFLQVPVILFGRYVAACAATAAFVDGRGSRLAAGRTPRAGVGVPAALGSRSWCRRRGCRARRWRPPPGSSPSRHPAAPAPAPAAPRSAGPNLGRARSPPDQNIEHKYEAGRERSVVRQGRSESGWAALGSQLSRTRGTTEDSRGLTNLEVSGRAERSTWTKKVTLADGLLSRLLPVCCPAAWHWVTKARGRIPGSGLTCWFTWWARQSLNR